ncbi:MAG: hypothetical protein DMF50_12720 [Acidobacteria bacterium]|nr:MAG: hypothetical protein DMF50_12720 [Acidobacteriota bacterium]
MWNARGLVAGLLLTLTPAPALAAVAYYLATDVPATLGSTDFTQAQIVQSVNGTYTLALAFGGGLVGLRAINRRPDGTWLLVPAAAGVPVYANLLGADRDSGGNLVVAFDVPTNLGGVEYLPGQLVRWNGGTSFGLYFADPAWPVEAGLRGFSFVPAAGSVPDGDGVPGTLLRVGLTAGNLTLSWGASCAAGDSDYEVYQGSLARPFVYNHTQRLCTTGGATSASFASPAGSAYFLVAPRNSIREGSYGRASSGAERPQGATACLPQQIALSCP